MLKAIRAKVAPASHKLGDTRTRILSAAEQLFAERGVDAVSVRAILKEAGVNVALANYHFGSREGLIRELLKSRVTPVIDEQLLALEAVDRRGHEATLEDVLRAYCAPAARWIVERPQVAKLLAQLHLSTSPELSEMARNLARPVLHRFGDAVVRTLPIRTDPRRLLLRFQIALGTLSYVSAHWDEVLQSTRKRFGADATPDAETLTDELVAFMAAGFRAAPRGGGGTR